VGWKDVVVPRPYPREFRDDVVRVARNREDGVTIEQVATDFGIHPMTLTKWMRQADIDDGAKPGISRPDSAELRICAGETACWSRRTRSCAVLQRICRRPICREKALPARD
jgi:transposase